MVENVLQAAAAEEVDQKEVTETGVSGGADVYPRWHEVRLPEENLQRRGKGKIEEGDGLLWSSKSVSGETARKR